MMAYARSASQEALRVQCDGEAQRTVTQHGLRRALRGAHGQTAPERAVGVHRLEAMVSGRPGGLGVAPADEALRLHIEDVGEIAGQPNGQSQADRYPVMVAERERLAQPAKAEKARHGQADAAGRDCGPIGRQLPVRHDDLGGEMGRRGGAQQLPRVTVDVYRPSTDETRVAVEQPSLARLVHLAVGLGDQDAFADIDRQLCWPDADFIAHRRFLGLGVAVTGEVSDTQSDQRAMSAFGCIGRLA